MQVYTAVVIKTDCHRSWGASSSKGVDFNLANAKNVSLPLFFFFFFFPCRPLSSCPKFILFYFLIFSRCLLCAFRIDSLLFFCLFFPPKKKKKKRTAAGAAWCVQVIVVVVYTLRRRWFSDSVFDSALKRAVRACGWCGFNFAWMDGASFPAPTQPGKCYNNRFAADRSPPSLSI